MISTIRNALQMASNNISLISNNLANASTTGFKRSEGEFTHFYAEQVERAGLHVGSGAMNEGIRRQFTQGAMRATNGALDLAISGVGMFMTGSDVEGDVTFTRDGSFLLDSAGYLRTVDNRTLFGVSGEPLQIPPRRVYEDGRQTLIDNIDINNAGRINVTYGDGSIVEMGTVALARFANMSGLKALGSGQYVATDRSGPAQMGTAMTDTFGQVMHGHLEASNTDVTEELARLMKAQQAYSGSSRMLQTAADITKRLIG